MASYNFCMNLVYYSLEETANKPRTLHLHHYVYDDLNTAKAGVLLACLGWYPVFSLPVHAALWRLLAVKLLLTLVDPSRVCADSVLHTPLCTLRCPPAATFTHTCTMKTQTYVADKHENGRTYAVRPSVVEHMMDGPVRERFTSGRPSFFLSPPTQSPSDEVLG